MATQILRVPPDVGLLSDDNFPKWKRKLPNSINNCFLNFMYIKGISSKASYFLSITRSY